LTFTVFEQCEQLAVNRISVDFVAGLFALTLALARVHKFCVQHSIANIDKPVRCGGVIHHFRNGFECRWAFISV
jgi:hypothetical protein